MRRSLIAALALFAAAVLCIGASFASVSPAKDNIEYTQETAFGDPNVLEGLNICTWLQYNRRLCWKSDVSYEKADGQVAPRWTTEFHRIKGDVYQNKELFGESINKDYFGYSYSGVQLYTDQMYTFETRENDWVDKLFEGKDPEEKIYKEIKLKDVTEYYEICGALDLPGLYYSMDVLGLASGELEHMKEQEAADSYAGELETAQAICDFFRIPVLEEETIVAEGYPGSYHVTNKDNTDAYYMYTEGVRTEDKCFFWFNNRTAFGRIVDCSRIPGGYGIYCLPYKLTEESGTNWTVQKAEVFPDYLCNAYPIDEESLIFNVSLNGDQTQLRIITRDKDDMLRLTIVDAETFETLQVVDISSAYSEEWCYIDSGDDYIICRDYENILHAYYDPGSGVYEERVAVPLDFTDDSTFDSKAWNSAYRHAIAFDGSRLTCCFWDDYQFEDEELYGHGVITRNYTANLQITIYDAEGLQYAGTLICSLDKCNQYGDRSLGYKTYSGEAYVYQDHWIDTILRWE